jgi:putative membrane protein
VIPISYFPSIDATLNAASALLLLAGYVSIRRRRIGVHRACMLSAVGTSTLFLICYLWYHAHHGITRFPQAGFLRTCYLALLGSHTVLAVAIVPLVLITLTRALRRNFRRHRQIARWTLPAWVYVSVTGVVVYWMLYHLAPAL